MTAEIAVMNSGAVAMAADSAASISYDQGLKVYNSADKLFQLDGNSPVGVMVYGGAEYVGVPWETVIKLYRKYDTGPYGYLLNYSEKFIEFLKSPSLLSDEHIDTAFLEIFAAFVRDLNTQISNQLPSDIDPLEVDIGQEIEKFCSKVSLPPRLTGCDASYEEHLKTRFGDAFGKVFDSNFEALSLSDRERCTKLILDILLAEPSQNDENTSGLVIAGFGEAELFPSAWRCLIGGILPNRILRMSVGSDALSSITLQNGAVIVPFAQKEMVDNFMTGVDPELEHHFFSAVGELLNEYIEHFTEKVKSFGDIQKSTEYEAEAREVAAKTLKGLRSELRNYSREHHIDPVIDAVAVLPKDELASMAETLVALTSFKRRVSIQAQTVGGAIDVAVISKGDGFVWIKRKHYFDPTLNVRYIRRVQKKL